MAGGQRCSVWHSRTRPAAEATGGGSGATPRPERRQGDARGQYPAGIERERERGGLHWARFRNACEATVGETVRHAAPPPPNSSPFPTVNPFPHEFGDPLVGAAHRRRGVGQEPHQLGIHGPAGRGGEGESSTDGPDQPVGTVWNGGGRDGPSVPWSLRRSPRGMGGCKDLEMMGGRRHRRPNEAHCFGPGIGTSVYGYRVAAEFKGGMSMVGQTRVNKGSGGRFGALKVVRSWELYERVWRGGFRGISAVEPPPGRGHRCTCSCRGYSVGQ